MVGGSKVRLFAYVDLIFIGFEPILLWDLIVISFPGHSFRFRIPDCSFFFLVLITI